MNEPSIRMRLGNYELLQELAAGGMATVYVARHIGAAGFERLVVIKRVHRHLLKDEEFTTMFLDEARMASKIHHPNVVPVTNVVEEAGELFLVMDYVDAVTLSKLRFVASRNEDANPHGTVKRLSPPVVTRILADTLSGLHAAHEATDMRGAHIELVHRDVSPQNILVGADGIARLIDFGIAKAAERATHTATGSLKGKYAYMSPEQATGRPIDRRTDVFAAGVVLYEALIGDRLFQADSQLEILKNITEAPIPPPSSRAPDVSPALDAVVLKALERDIDKRYATAADFLEALERAAPMASRRDVIAEIEFYQGRVLEKQRQGLRTLMAELEPVVPTLGGTVSERRVSNPPFQSGSDVSLSGRPFADAMTAGGAGPSIPARVKSGPPVWLLALFAAAGIATFTLVATFMRRNKPEDTTAVATTTAVTTQTEATIPLDVDLVLLADRPILSVRAASTRKIDIADKRASVTVGPWSGSLAIEATLEGGVIAKATAIEHGPKELLLVPEPAQPVPANAKPTATAKPKPTATHQNTGGSDINLAR
ncbi:MAG TPA: serine/threonine-protein kinase [Polyangiaceae bacterium]